LFRIFFFTARSMRVVVQMVSMSSDLAISTSHLLFVPGFLMVLLLLLFRGRRMLELLWNRRVS
jgi:hypothetical protein